MKLIAGYAFMLLIVAARVVQTGHAHDESEHDHTSCHRCKSASPSPSMCKERTPPPSPSRMCPPKKSASPSPSESESPSSIPSPSISSSSSPLPSASSSPSTTILPSSTPTTSPSVSLIPSASPSLSPSPSPSLSPLSSPSSSSSATPSTTLTPSLTPSLSPSATPSLAPSSTPSPSPSPTASPSLSSSPTPSPSLSATPSATPSPSRTPSPSPSATPSLSPSPILSAGQPSPASAPEPSVCFNQRLRTLADFSLIAFGSATTPQEAETVALASGSFGGKVAVNGALRLSDFGVNQDGTCDSIAANQSSLIVNGTVDFAPGHIFCGNLLTSDESNVINLPSFSPNGTLIIGDINGTIDFEQGAKDLVSIQSLLCSLNRTGTTEASAGGELTLRASTEASQVFAVDVADLTNTSHLRLEGGNASTPDEVIVQLMGSGPAEFSGFGIDAGTIPPGQIIWAFCNNHSAIIEQIQLPGIILAPGSNITFQHAQIIGAVFSASVRGTGSVEISLPRCLPNASSV